MPSCSENGDGAVKGSQMGQISEVRRSLVDIWKRIAGVVCDLQGLFLFCGILLNIDVWQAWKEE